jgi:hypothetical protein
MNKKKHNEREEKKTKTRKKKNKTKGKKKGKKCDVQNKSFKYAGFVGGLAVLGSNEGWSIRSFGLNDGET